LFAPRGTPTEMVTRLNGEVTRILGEPEIEQKLLEQGTEVSAFSVGEFAAFVRRERMKYQEIIKDAKLTPP
jgi:tripartite-type tricarboxylate transporter receptor subunit TctC